MSGTLTPTPASGSTIGPGDGLTLSWSGYAGFPAYARFYVTTAYGEELAFSWALAQDDIVHDGFVLVDLNDSAEVTPTLKRIGGWNSPDGTVKVRVETEAVVPTSDETFYADYSVSPILDQPILDHTEAGLDTLLAEFQQASKLKSWLAAHLDQVQDLEDGMQPLLASHSIDIAVGVGLDVIGAILGLPRGGLIVDDDYRLRLRAEVAINNSEGTQFDLINVLQLLIGLPTKDIQYDEYFPKTVYLRPRNHIVDDDTDVVLALLKRAAPAGTEIHIVYSTVETSDDDIFRFSTVADTTQTSATYGTENGSLNGAD